MRCLLDVAVLASLSDSVAVADDTVTSVDTSVESVATATVESVELVEASSAAFASRFVGQQTLAVLDPGVDQVSETLYNFSALLCRLPFLLSYYFYLTSYCVCVVVACNELRHFTSLSSLMQPCCFSSLCLSASDGYYS